MRGRRRSHLQQRSERQLSADLHRARGGVAAQERTERAGWRTDRADDASKLRVGDVAHRLIEVGMVEQVEGLGPHLQLRAFPARNADVLHQAQVRVKEPWAPDLVAPLLAE